MQEASQEQFLAARLLGTCSPSEQAILLTEVANAKLQPNGQKHWLNLWLQRTEGSIFDHIHRETFRASAGLNLGHPVTWPKDKENPEISVIFNMQPKDTTFYVSRLSMPVPTTEPPFWYQSNDVSPYFLIWYVVPPSFLTKGMEADDQSRDYQELQMHLDYFLGNKYMSFRDEEIVRKCGDVRKAMLRRLESGQRRRANVHK